MSLCDGFAASGVWLVLNETPGRGALSTASFVDAIGTWHKAASVLHFNIRRVLVLGHRHAAISFCARSAPSLIEGATL